MQLHVLRPADSWNIVNNRSIDAWISPRQSVAIYNVSPPTIATSQVSHIHTNTMRLSSLLHLVVEATIAHALFDPSRFTWYTTPANNFSSTLPLGNGRLGAAVWGSTVENITLNENSIWGGQFMDRANPDAYNALDPVRSMLKQGNITAAGEMTLEKMVGSPDEPRAYHPLGSLVLDFGHEGSHIENYTRSLDLLKGRAVVDYEYHGVKFRYVRLAE